MEEPTPLNINPLTVDTAQPDIPEPPAALSEGDPIKPTFTPILKILSGILLFLACGFCAALAGIILILAIVNVLPALLYHSLDEPFVALFCTIGYLATILGLAVVVILGGKLAFMLVRRQDITRKIIITCGMAVMIAAACLFIALPASAAPLDFGHTYYIPTELRQPPNQPPSPQE